MNEENVKKENEKVQARNNNNRGHEYENKEFVRSNLVGTAFAIFVGIILFLIEYFALDSINVSMIAVGMPAASVQSLYEGFRSKKAYLIVIGFIEIFIAVFAILIFMAQVIAK